MGRYRIVRRNHAYVVIDEAGQPASARFHSYDRATGARDALIAQECVRERGCICCGESFASEGPHNRMCDSCRGATSGVVANECTLHRYSRIQN